jgi:hypothetical protein
MINPDNFDINQLTDQHILNFVKSEIDHCAQNQIEVQLTNCDTVALNGVECGGYFMDTPNGVLAVAMGKQYLEWLPTFVHETCHKDQYVEKSPVWDLKIKEYFNANDILDMWLNQAVELTKPQLKSVLDQVIAVELDCEKRSIEKIKKYNLPIDQTEYIQKANAYVYYHFAIVRMREWGHKSVPYENPKIWQKMPVDFNQNYSTINRKLMNLLLRHCW